MHTLGFLERLEPEVRDGLFALGHRRTFPRRSYIVHEGEQSQLVLVVRDGLVKIDRSLASGRTVLIGVRGPGALIGELAAFGDGARTATVSTLTQVEVIAIPGDAFVDFVEQRPEVSQAMIRTLAERLRTVNDHLLEFGAGDALARVAARLVELVDDEELARIVAVDRPSGPGDSITLTLPVSQEELGEWTGLSREAVVKALRRLRQLGWIDTDRREVTIHRLDALRERSGVDSRS